MDMRLAIIGATGLVGEELLRIIEEAQDRPAQVGLFASESSRGSIVEWAGQELTVAALEDCNFADWDMAFFCVGDELSREYVPKAIAAGCAVVDKSNAYRLDPAVPLVVAGVNDSAVGSANHLVANPNCSTIILSYALKPLADSFGLTRVWAATYQSVSGAGRSGVSALMEEIEEARLDEDEDSEGYQLPVGGFFGNVIPAIGSFDAEGRCGEESKLLYESRKILGLPSLPMLVHSARVPVFVGHSIAVSVELANPASLAEVEQALRASDYLKWMDGNLLPGPLGSSSHDKVEIGRLRTEDGAANAFSFFISGDNLHLGAALNGWRIMQIMQGAGAISRMAVNS